MRGKGKYQEHLYKLTTIQIIQVLLERPFTYDEIRSKTNIQGTRLKQILESLVEKDAIIHHKLSASITELTNDKNNNIKIGSYYYILNLDNPEIRQYIADTTHSYLKEQIAQNENLKSHSNDTINKIDKTSSDINAYDYCSHQLIEETDKEIEKDFPDRKIVELTEEDNKKILSNIEYQECLKSFKDSEEEHRFHLQEQIRKLKPILLEMMQGFLKTGASKYDFLISFSCHFYGTHPNSNRVLYYIHWNIINDSNYTYI